MLKSTKRPKYYSDKVRMSKLQEFRLSKTETKRFFEDVVGNAALVKMFRKCKDRIYIRLTWELLTLYGTVKQLKHYDRIRRKHVNKLMDTYCTVKQKCTVEMIGSISPKSDIDINLTSKKNIDSVLKKIYKAHDKEYPSDSLEEMFDVNMYASVFHFLDDRCTRTHHAKGACFPPFSSDLRQRTWSFLRIVEFSFQKPVVKNTIVSLPAYRCLYVKALALHDQLQQETSGLTVSEKNQTYGQKIQLYLNALTESKTAEGIEELFSSSKFLENDTYRSVGAVLHIVEKAPSLTNNVLFDSVYDNLGFILKNVYTGIIPFESSFETKFMRVGKYLERICDAIKTMATATDTIENISHLSGKLNRNRKNLEMPADRDVTQLLTLLEVDEHGRSDPDSFVCQFVHFLLSKLLPVDKMLVKAAQRNWCGF